MLEVSRRAARQRTMLSKNLRVLEVSRRTARLIYNAESEPAYVGSERAARLLTMLSQKLRVLEVSRRTARLLTMLSQNLRV
ncbi:hypothetical protein J6590_082068 [Homalodisca vitripennis]|nr:hypothetical protein J6590_082068 [Homalodisca vitripennis]